VPPQLLHVSEELTSEPTTQEGGTGLTGHQAGPGVCRSTAAFLQLVEARKRFRTAGGVSDLEPRFLESLVEGVAIPFVGADVQGSDSVRRTITQVSCRLQ